MIKFWPSRAPGKGSATGRKFLAPPYYSQCAVFASPLSAFSLCSAFSQHAISTVRVTWDDADLMLDPNYDARDWSSVL